MSTPLVPIELNPNQPATSSIIWLHGLGADGNDFVPIAQELALPGAVRYVFPNAPAIPVTINRGYVMPAWYDITQSDIGKQADAAGIMQSTATLHALIDAEVARGIPAHRIVLAGFSQGGVIAYHAGLRYPHTLGGIMALSTYLPLTDTLATARHPANQNTALFCAHGKADNVVPQALGQAAHQTLNDWGYTVAWRTYPMQHSVCHAEIQDIRTWLLSLPALSAPTA